MAYEDASAEDLRSLLQLLKDVGSSHCELRRFDYAPDTFGSFELHLGGGHRRLRFTWDGRDEMLSADSGILGSSGDVPTWTHLFDKPFPHGSGLWDHMTSVSRGVMQSNPSLERP